MHRLLTIEKKEDIPESFRETPIGDLLLYHNANLAHKSYEQAKLLIGMCIDYRTALNIPQNFAFMIRVGGANLRNNEFKVSYAVAVGGVTHMVLIGHTQCGMVNLKNRKEQFIKGLCENGGWDQQTAEAHFEQESPKFEIGNEINFLLNESKRLSQKYPKVKVVPLLYKVEDRQLYGIHNGS